MNADKCRPEGPTWQGSSAGSFVHDFYANAATTLLSIALTVLLIDRLYERREAEYLKQQLIREMGSSDKGFALRAAKETSARGWLTDGSLRDCDLSQAALTDAIRAARRRPPEPRVPGPAYPSR